MNTFTFDKDLGQSAGESNFVSESGKYTGAITKALYKVASTGTKGVELSFESSEGLAANYLSIWYEKADGAVIKGGMAMVNAIMGCTQTGSLSMSSRAGNDGAENFAPELEGKSIGLLLQKCLYTKNDGTDGYKFEIRIPFVAQNGKTLTEQMGNRDAVSIDKMLSTLKDKDERKPAQNQGQASDPYAQNGVPDSFADDGWGSMD